MPPIRAASTLLFGAGLLLMVSAIALAISIPLVPREGFGDLAAFVGALFLVLIAGGTFAASLLVSLAAGPPSPARWRSAVASLGAALGVAVAVVLGMGAAESGNAWLLLSLALAALLCLAGLGAAFASLRTTSPRASA